MHKTPQEKAQRVGPQPTNVSNDINSCHRDMSLTTCTSAWTRSTIDKRVKITEQWQQQIRHAETDKGHESRLRRCIDTVVTDVYKQHW